eukprot:3502855-Rhodomonas_salina.1
MCAGQAYMKVREENEVQKTQDGFVPDVINSTGAYIKVWSHPSSSHSSHEQKMQKRERREGGAREGRGRSAKWGGEGGA